MWHIKLNNINKNQFKLIKNIINDKIYIKEITIYHQIYEEYYLILDIDEIESAPEALTKGENEIKILSSILNLQGYKNNIIADYPYKIHENGTRTCYMSFKDKVKITDELISIYTNNKLVYSSEKEKQIIMNDIYSKSQNNEVKLKLLAYLNKEKNWINAYKIYEVLKKNYKKEKELKEYPALSNFAHTANSEKALGEESRHAINEKDQAPKNNANLEKSYITLKELSISFLQSN